LQQLRAEQYGQQKGGTCFLYGWLTKDNQWLFGSEGCSV
jgi:hypothetical protein